LIHVKSCRAKTVRAIRHYVASARAETGLMAFHQAAVAYREGLACWKGFAPEPCIRFR
jgi:hypothetical protein